MARSVFRYYERMPSNFFQALMAIGVTTALVVACGSSDGGGIGGGGPGGSGVACDPATASGCGGEKCDTALGCVECLGDTDCRAGEPFCTRGRCGACRVNADCGVAAPSCWPRDNKCHAACTSNAQDVSGNELGESRAAQDPIPPGINPGARVCWPSPPFRAG
jgi:hypothetical protein